MTRILLTGFEPFLKWTVNPSAEVVAAIALTPLTGVEFRTLVLPVAFAEAGGIIRKEMDAWEPEIVVMLGQGGGGALRVERLGVNMDDIPGRCDNRGESAEERPIVPEGPAAYFATLRARRLVTHLNASGIPAMES
ncbi:MAG TPA: pyroglutamyl-peptidase I, partial [Chloroflexota bacterium]|nr:pyroglutamyl-peptidase I [Chloroflexota bacterium]